MSYCTFRSITQAATRWTGIQRLWRFLFGKTNQPLSIDRNRLKTASLSYVRDGAPLSLAALTRSTPNTLTHRHFGTSRLAGHQFAGRHLGAFITPLRSRALDNVSSRRPRTEKTASDILRPGCLAARQSDARHCDCSPSRRRQNLPPIS
jgi:hypothetical protein